MLMARVWAHDVVNESQNLKRRLRKARSPLAAAAFLSVKMAAHCALSLLADPSPIRPLWKPALLPTFGNLAAMFSGAVKIGDLDDFISPAQACVVNLEGGKLPNNVLADAEVRRAAPSGPGAAVSALT
jgi:hypothetical protein